MGKTSFRLEEAGIFPPGTKVGVYSRHTDSFGGWGSAPLKTVTVGSDGTATISGLVEDAPYFLAAEVQPAPVQVGDDVNVPPPPKEKRTIAITPKSEASLAHPDIRSTIPEVTARRVREAEAATAAYREAEKRDPLAASPAPGRTDPRPQITGARSSVPKAQADLEARRTPQHAVRGAQRSDTPFGEAVPVGEPSPTEKQEDVPKRTKQRSDTKTGEAERAPTKAEARKTKQPSRAKQSSATKRGEATQKSRRAQKPRSRAKRGT